MNIIILNKFILKALQYTNSSKITKQNLKKISGQSLYDFNNNLINRYELIILSYFEDFAFLVGLLSVFMQIGDSLINFFKTLAPKIQRLAIINSNKAIVIDRFVIIFFLTVLVILFMSYEIWMSYLQYDMIQEKEKFGLWSITVVISIILWSKRYFLQSVEFNILKYSC